MKPRYVRVEISLSLLNLLFVDVNRESFKSIVNSLAAVRSEGVSFWFCITWADGSHVVPM